MSGEWEKGIAHHTTIKWVQNVLKTTTWSIWNRHRWRQCFNPPTVILHQVLCCNAAPWGTFKEWLSYYYSTLTPIQWLPHTDNQRPKEAGHPRRGNTKVGPQNAPSTGSTALILKMAKNNCPRDVPKLLPSPPPMQLVQYMCSICNEILDSPIELGCGHTFCSKCCISLFQSKNPISPEPHCTSTSTITVDDIKKPLDLLINYINPGTHWWTLATYVGSCIYISAPSSIMHKVV